MKRRLSLSLYLTALAAAAIAAYFAYSIPEKEQVKGTVILEMKPSEISSMKFIGKENQVEIRPRQENGFTIRIREQIEKQIRTDTDSSTDAADAGQESDAGAEEKAVVTVMETKVSVYRASKEYDEALKNSLPLTAARDLGKPDQKSLAKFGLIDRKRTLEIETKGQKATFEIGDKTYGNTSFYLRQPDDGTVYLVPSGFIHTVDLRFPSFMDRRLVGFEWGEEDAVIISSQAGKKKLVRKGEGLNAVWADEAKPDAPIAALGDWVNNLFRIGAEEYLAEGETPAVEIALEVGFEKGGKALDHLKLAGYDAGGGKKGFLAQSGHTGQWVKLNAADVEAVISNVPIP